MTAAEDFLDAYLAASAASWRTFMDYREGKASAGEVDRKNRAEAAALRDLRAVIGGGRDD